LGVIKRQGITNTVVIYIGLFVGFINVIYIQPKLLTTEVLGLIRILFASSSIVAMLLPLGIGSITIKYFPKYKNDTGHHGFFGLLFLFTIIGFIIFSSLLLLFKGNIIEMYQKESFLFTQYFNVIIPFCLVIAFNAIFGIYCQALFKSTIPAFLNDVVIRVINIALVVLYYLKFYSLSTFIYSFTLSYLLQTFCLLIYIYKVDKPKLRIDFKFFKTQDYKEVIKYGLLLSITAFASLGIKYTDTIFIGKYLSLSMVGIYSIAAFIPTIIEAPVGAIERISNAKIADSWSKDNLAEIEKIYKESTNYLTLFGGLLVTMLLINIDFLYTFLPQVYSVAKPAIYILCFSTYFNMITGLNGSIIFSSKNYYWGSLFLIIMLVCSITLNILLIPRFGIIGAAFSNAIASFAFNLLKFIFIKNKYQFQPFNLKHLYFIILVSVLVFVFNYSIFENNLLELITKNSLVLVCYYFASRKIEIVENNFITEIFTHLYDKLRSR